jgi:hypothetical protein
VPELISILPLPAGTSEQTRQRPKLKSTLVVIYSQHKLPSPKKLAIRGSINDRRNWNRQEDSTLGI